MVFALLYYAVDIATYCNVTFVFINKYNNRNTVHLDLLLNPCTNCQHLCALSRWTYVLTAVLLYIFYTIYPWLICRFALILIEYWLYLDNNSS